MFLFYSCRETKQEHTKKSKAKWKPISRWCVTQKSVFALLLHRWFSEFRSVYLTSWCCYVSQTFSVESSNIIAKRQDANSNRLHWISRNSNPGKELNIQMQIRFQTVVNIHSLIQSYPRVSYSEKHKVFKNTVATKQYFRIQHEPDPLLSIILSTISKKTA